MKFFFKSIKCHTFSEPQARPDLNDDDDDDDDADNDDVDNNNNNDISEDNKEEEEENEIFFSKVSSVIPFRNHKLGLI